MVSDFFCIVTAVLSELTLFSVFAAAAYTDFKTQTVPWQLLPLLYSVLFLNTLINKSLVRAVFDLFGAAIIFLIFYLNAKLAGGGGGDALFFPAIPFQHGLFAGLFIVLVGCLATTCAYVVKHIRRGGKLDGHVSLPLVPGVFLTYILFLILSIWRIFL